MKRLVKQKRQTRRQYRLNIKEQQIVDHIKSQTLKGNIDNISRTVCYEKFYQRNKEIKWAYLASFVSRNAGWNMTDLQGIWFKKMIEEEKRRMLFLTYERANWLIFSDAYPQLLLYEISKRFNRPYFYLLKEFGVSVFMEIEWERYWEERDGDRLVTSLIINEQNVIQKPVIDHPVYKRQVFNSILFKFEDWLHFSSVLFPTLYGELFGFSVSGFTKLDNRIMLGKRLYWLLFHEDYYQYFYQFTQSTVHTGSRHDYEQYLSGCHKRETPFLRTVYPIISHRRGQFFEWFDGTQNIERYFRKAKIPHPYHITKWYLKKRRQLQTAVLLKEAFNVWGGNKPRIL